MILIIATDMISHEHIDPIKISIVSGVIVAVFIMSFQSNSFIAFTFPNGDKSLAMVDFFNILNLYQSFLHIFLYGIIQLKSIAKHLKI